MNQLLNGFALGTLLVLMAIGLTIILGLMRVINFTHGVIYALGAYSVVTLFNYTGFWPCLIIGPIVLGLFGMGLEATLIRPLYKRDPLHTMLLTFGLALMIEDLIRMTWGDAAYPMSASGGPVRHHRFKIVYFFQIPTFYHSFFRRSFVCPLVFLPKNFHGQDHPGRDL